MAAGIAPGAVQHEEPADDSDTGVFDQVTGVGGTGRELVAALILRMAVVAADPVPGNLVRGGSLKKPFPQIDILDGLCFGDRKSTRLNSSHP